MKLRRCLALMLATVVVGAACGGGGEGPSTGARPRGTTSPTVQAKPFPSDTDLLRAGRYAYEFPDFTVFFTLPQTTPPAVWGGGTIYSAEGDSPEVEALRRAGFVLSFFEADPAEEGVEAGAQLYMFITARSAENLSAHIKKVTGLAESSFVQTSLGPYRGTHVDVETDNEFLPLDLVVGDPPPPKALAAEGLDVARLAFFPGEKHRLMIFEVGERTFVVRFGGRSALFDQFLRQQVQPILESLTIESGQ
jgi:hypothetical protein